MEPSGCGVAKLRRASQHRTQQTAGAPGGRRRAPRPTVSTLRTARMDREAEKGNSVTTMKARDVKKKAVRVCVAEGCENNGRDERRELCAVQSRRQVFTGAAAVSSRSSAWRSLWRKLDVSTTGSANAVLRPAGVLDSPFSVNGAFIHVR